MPRTPARQPVTAPVEPRAAIEPPVRVLRKFRLVFNAVKTHFKQVEKRAGVGGAQLWALSVVQGQSGLGVNDLARAMDLGPDEQVLVAQTVGFPAVAPA